MDKARFWRGTEKPQSFLTPARESCGQSKHQENEAQGNYRSLRDTVGRNRGRLDVMRHKNNKKAERVRGWFNGETMYFAKGKIRLQMRIVRMNGGQLDGVAKCDGMLVKEPITRPGNACGLPVPCYCLKSHAAAPIAS
jgi:hypothetical protein